MKLKLGSIMWTSHLPMLVRSAKNLDFLELSAYSSRSLDEFPETLDEALKILAESDIILLYRSSGRVWETIEQRLQALGRKVPIICVGHDPSYWMLSTVRPEIVARVNAYITINGEENFTSMLCYLAREVCGLGVKVEAPKPVPWEGLYHPKAEGVFSAVEDYLAWYDAYKSSAGRLQSLSSANRHTVGILFSRQAWVNHNLETEDTLIDELEKLGLNVIPVFSNSVKDKEKGCKGSGEVVCETFLKENHTSRIDALVKMQFFPLCSGRENGYEGSEVARQGVEILKRFDVPVFCPFSSFYKTAHEWRDEPQGLSSSLIGFSIAMPEFEGVIEPFIVGARNEKEDSLARKVPLKERCRKSARRIANWVQLRNKPVEARRVAFILHNNPCASVEATVGGGAQLDTLETVARIMQQMKAAGYAVEPPADGKELIETIMDRKAISEFRWTTVDEIVKNGGVLKQVTKAEYEEWFDTLSTGVKERMNAAWGKPPGEAIDGVPAAMVYESKILVTGVSYGHAVVCVQPKRGCAGARCDGQVCKILHDPDIPPPHQYMATYRYLERDFGADVIIHVGTHGNLEFLPGKSVGLSGDCYPDMAIGDMPHLYIYNADNPAEGTIAKRRSYATLVNHMQTVMTQGGLYEELEELGQFLGEYEHVKHLDPGRAHALQHLIMDAIKGTRLNNEMNINYQDTEGKARRAKLSTLTEDALQSVSFDEIAGAAHGALSKIRNTQIQDGLHIFGQRPEGERRVDFINSILRYDAGDDISLRKIVAGMMGMNLNVMLEDASQVCPEHHKSYGELLEEVDTVCKAFIRLMLSNGSDPYKLADEVLGGQLKNRKHIDSLGIIRERLVDLNRRIDESREIASLLHGFDGCYIQPGPSGLITRGRDDILPTGRDFYSLDPHRVPTKAAWKIGQKLAQTVSGNMH